VRSDLITPKRRETDKTDSEHAKQHDACHGKQKPHPCQGHQAKLVALRRQTLDGRTTARDDRDLPPEASRCTPLSPSRTRTMTVTHTMTRQLNDNLMLRYMQPAAAANSIK